MKTELKELFDKIEHQLDAKIVHIQMSDHTEYSFDSEATDKAFDVRQNEQTKEVCEHPLSHIIYDKVSHSSICLMCLTKLKAN